MLATECANAHSWDPYTLNSVMFWCVQYEEVPLSYRKGVHQFHSYHSSIQIEPTLHKYTSSEVVEILSKVTLLTFCELQIYPLLSGKTLDRVWMSLLLQYTFLQIWRVHIFWITAEFIRLWNHYNWLITKYLCCHEKTDKGPL